MSALAGLPRTAATHFQLHFFAAALHLRAHAPEQRFAFLADYCGDADAAQLGEPSAWDSAVADWEAGEPFPLTRLTRGGKLGPLGLRALFLIGLVDEDACFGSVFEAFTGHPRPTPGLLHAWWPQMRPDLRRLAELGLAESTDAEPPRADAPLRVPSVAWDAVRGDVDAQPAPWVRVRPADSLLLIDDLILAPAVVERLKRAPAVLWSGAASAVVVRGPSASGRRSVLGAIAREAGCGVVEVRLEGGDPRWRQVGPLATLLDAMPVAVLDAAPGALFEIPELAGWAGPVGVSLGRHGGAAGPCLDRAVTIELDIPGRAERARHWASVLDDPSTVGEATANYRMTGGNIRRTAALAVAEAALGGRDRPSSQDIGRGVRTLHGRLLDVLATRVETEHDWDCVAVRPETMRELRLLEARCRYREQIGEMIGGAAPSAHNAGVRVLLTGPSGSGKTLAARTLAGVLDIDLYRVDLAAVVNKYLGETEKNLDRLLSRAEEADAALLLDEGDALMTRRTGVSSSNDRYANLETNFLLQRLETFSGILVVTSNGAERIDSAFHRRMDMVIDFGLPDELERWSIWQLHLPIGHQVPDDVVGELATRCELSGGQLRNAVLHASLLALEASCALGPRQLEAAVRREYSKAGRLCPLGAAVGLG